MTLLLLLLSGCASSPMYEEVKSALDDQATHTLTTPGAVDTAQPEQIPIFVVKHGHHTGVILPVDAAERIHPQIVTDFTNQSERTPQYWEFGWGDERYYTAKYTDAVLAVRAIIAPTSSLVHVIGIDRHPQRYFKQVSYRELSVTPDDYAKMLSYIRQSLQISADNLLTKTIESRENDRLFYKGRGEYALFNNCNHWTTQILNLGGIAIRPNTMTGGQIMQQVGGAEFTKP